MENWPVSENEVGRVAVPDVSMAHSDTLLSNTKQTSPVASFGLIVTVKVTLWSWVDGLAEEVSVIVGEIKVDAPFIVTEADMSPMSVGKPILSICL